MNRTTMTVYLVSVLVMWVPLAIAVRRTFGGNVTEMLVGGLLMAGLWPFAIPVLSSVTMSRRERRLAELGSARATMRSSTIATMAPGWSSAVADSMHPRPLSPILAPAESVVTRSAITTN